MSLLLNMSFLMDGVSAKEMEQVQAHIKALDKQSIEIILTFLDMRFLAIHSEANVPDEFLQRQEGRKEELKDLKDSILQALAPNPVIEPDDAGTPGLEGVTP